jgi:class 3 adenylate cyclase/tetratricopeptide (TPR) repeat protein
VAIISAGHEGSLPAGAGAPSAGAPARRLAALLLADIAGYTRLMERAEDATHTRMMRLMREVVQPALAAEAGQIVKHTGDGFLAIFASVVAAARAALAIQSTVLAMMRDLPAHEAMLFRMGLNLADVIVEVEDVFGDGVNVAARLQSYAEPGGLIVSSAVAEAIAGQVAAQVTDIGDFYPKNLSRPIRAFAVRPLGAPGAPAPPRSSQAEHPSIAVLPFRHAGRGEDAYLAEGLIEGVIHVLSGLDGLLVISHGSTHGYAKRRPDVREVGRELGVRYVLSGSVHRSGDRLRIFTELNDAESGAVASSHRYDGALAELFELQDKISAGAVATIAPHIRERELQRARRKPPETLTAYDLLLRAVDLMLRLEVQDFDRARGLLQRAIAEDPGYAPAWAYAAYWHMLRIGQGLSPDLPADNAEALRCATAALQRDEGYALALAIRGHMLSFLERDFQGAAALLDRALESGPNVALAWSFASATSGYLGDGPAAVQRAERALRLSPRDPFAFRHEHMLSQAHYINGDMTRAAEWGERAARRNPRMTSNLRTLIAALTALGREERAREVAAQFMVVEPGFRIGPWSARTPLHGALLEGFVARLRAAGLPD